MSDTMDTNTLDQTSEPAERPSAPEPPLDMMQALWQLRMLCCGLGLGLIVVSLALTGFIVKQFRDIRAETNARTQQAAQVHQQMIQIQNNQQRLRPIVEELARYSFGNPALMEVFTRAGLNLNASQPSNAPPPSVSTPAGGVSQ